MIIIIIILVITFVLAFFIAILLDRVESGDNFGENRVSECNFVFFKDHDAFFKGLEDLFLFILNFAKTFLLLYVVANQLFLPCFEGI